MYVRLVFEERTRVQITGSKHYDGWKHTEEEKYANLHIGNIYTRD